MTAKEALNKLDLNIGEISPTAHTLCSVISKELEELDRYRLLCYGDLPSSMSDITLPNGYKARTDVGYVIELFRDKHVKEWLETGK